MSETATAMTTDEALTFLALPPKAPAAPAAIEQPVAEPELSFEGLPDPKVDSTAYDAELNARVERYKAESAKITQETRPMTQTPADDHQALGQRAWQTFSAAHPDLAQDEGRCREAAAAYAREASAQGKTFEDICGALPDEMARRLRQDAAEADEGRTAGMFGGQEAGNRPTDSAPQEPTNMSQELAALQKGMWKD